ALKRLKTPIISATRALSRKCRDPRIFFVPCTIGDCTFADAMLDLGASINVMLASIYRSLNFGDLEPIGMTIQLANKSIVQPLGVLEDVLVQGNELIFPADFYVLDMEDETSGKESTLILGRPFLMTARTKIDVHAGMLLMEFGDTLVQFNIFEAMKHPTEDHSLFGIDLLDEIFTGSTDEISCLGFVDEEANCEEDNHSDITDLDFEVELSELLNQVCNLENLKSTTNAEVKVAEIEESPTAQLATIFTTEIKSAREGRVKEEIKSSRSKQPKTEIMSAHLVPSQNQVGQTDPNPLTEKSPSPPQLMELKPLSSHLNYAYLDKEQQLPRRLNPTILDVVKKEVTKLLAASIIYPISDSQWVSPVQVVPKMSRMTVMENQQDELATRKDHFPLPFIDQVLEKLAGKSHYCFLDGFSGYMQIHIAPEDQHKTTFTCPFGTFAYSRMPFGLCNALSTFQRLDFTVYANSFDACLENLSKVLKRCIDTNLVLNFEKCHFMVTEGIVLGHLVSNRGIEVDKAKIDIISSLPNPTSVREVRSFLGHASFYKRFIKNFSKLALPLSRLLQKDVEFNFDQPYIAAFQELKNRLTSAPVLQAPN
ncbi:Retrovirus-related Pol polyprotein from transposon 17.6, partial [Mucuna pruriens]